jgi:hypothetical protein
MYQLHVLRVPVFQAKGYVWLGNGKPVWTDSRGNLPALTLQERAASDH